MSESDFGQLAANIFSNRERYEKSIKSTYLTKTFMSTRDFFEFYLRANDECLQMTATSQQPDIWQFEENFSELDKYPKNLHKVKRPSNRANATLRGSSTTLSICETQPIAMPVKPACKPVMPDVRAIYADYKKMQQKLHKILLMNEKNNVAGRQLQAEQFHGLQVFSRDLDKLLPADGSVVRAFDEQQLGALEKLAHQMQELHFIQNNQVNFNTSNRQHKNTSSSHSQTSERLLQITDLLNNCLLALQTYAVD